MYNHSYHTCICICVYILSMWFLAKCPRCVWVLIMWIFTLYIHVYVGPQRQSDHNWMLKMQWKWYLLLWWWMVILFLLPMHNNDCFIGGLLYWKGSSNFMTLTRDTQLNSKITTVSWMQRIPKGQVICTKVRYVLFCKCYIVKNNLHSISTTVSLHCISVTHSMVFTCHLSFNHSETSFTLFIHIYSN